jgi:hypothetical protein
MQSVVYSSIFENGNLETERDKEKIGRGDDVHYLGKKRMLLFYFLKCCEIHGWRNHFLHKKYQR